MKYRTYARFVALALSLTLLTACGPKGESGSQSNTDGSVSSSQGSASTPDQSQPDLSLPDSSQPDGKGEPVPEFLRLLSVQGGRRLSAEGRVQA